MNCKKLHKNLIFYLDGDLPETEMIKMRTHLANCPDCAAFADKMMKTLGVLQSEKSPEVNPFFYTRLKAKMESQNEDVKKVANPIWTRVLQPALFSLLLLVGVYSGIKIGQNTEDQFYATNSQEEQVVPYLNEMEAEPIETFLME